MVFLATYLEKYVFDSIENKIKYTLWHIYDIELQAYLMLPTIYL